MAGYENAQEVNGEPPGEFHTSGNEQTQQQTCNTISSKSVYAARCVQQEETHQPLNFTYLKQGLKNE